MTPPAAAPEPAPPLEERRPEPEPEPDLYIHAGGRCASWAALARVCAAEALGTALLVLLAASPPAPAPLQAGLAVAALVQCFGEISGAQLNPCVSLAALLSGRMEPRRALLEAAAQLAGAALGGAALPDPRAALTLPGAGCALRTALCAEALCCACLVLANCAQWEREARGGGADCTWPLRVGAVVAALSSAAGGVSGGSMNPARSFGPALAAAHWERHWVYWAGPLSGAVVAAALHRTAWRSPRPPRPPHPDPAELRKPEPIAVPLD